MQKVLLLGNFNAHFDIKKCLAVLSRVLIYFLLRLAVRRLLDRVNYKLEVTIARQELP